MWRVRRFSPLGNRGEGEFFSCLKSESELF